MSRPTVAYSVKRLLGPAVLDAPCGHCGGPMIEDGQDAIDSVSWCCLNCGRPPGPPPPHEEPASTYGERLARVHHAAKANAYWAQQAEAS